MAQLIERTEWEKLPHANHILSVINGGSTINWKIGYGDKWGGLNGGGCCGTMPSTHNLNSPNLHSIILSLRQKTTNAVPPEFERYWTMLLSKEHSPWRSVLPPNGGIIYKNGTSWAYEIPISSTMSFPNTINLFIATRQTMVESGNVRIVMDTYNRILRHDSKSTFGEAMAIAIMQVQPASSKYGTAPRMFTTGNGWLGTAGMFSPKHFAQGVMTEGATSHPFSRLNYRPSCMTWRSSKAYKEWCTFLEYAIAKPVTTDEPRKFTRAANGTSLTYGMIRYYDIPLDVMLGYLRSPIV